MKTLNNYINEKFQITKNSKIIYAYHPKTKDELIDCIKEKIEKEGLGTEDNPLDLNNIDTSEITGMSYLFCAKAEYEQLCPLKSLSKKGYFDISGWNVSNVKSMFNMFTGSSFDGDISKWNVSKVENMHSMFEYSNFTGKNGSINNWDVSKVNDMGHMFTYSTFNGNISDWDVSNVENMEDMFGNSDFNGNISDWNVKKLQNIRNMFYMCPIEKNPPKWYKN